MDIKKNENVLSFYSYMRIIAVSLRIDFLFAIWQFAYL